MLTIGRKVKLTPAKTPSTRISEEDVLLDVPRRPMDSGGAVFVNLPNTGIVPLVDLSEPIRMINANYERLAKRARVFLVDR